MFQRVTVQFGIGLVIVGAVSAALLAMGGGPSPSDTLFVVVPGIALVVVGNLARQPERTSSMWLAAVLFAAVMMLGCLHGLTAFATLLGGSGTIDWWLLVQGALVPVGAVFIVYLAIASLRAGRQAVEATRVRPGKSGGNGRNRRTRRR